MSFWAEHTGELAALGTAICWTATAMAFESASNKVGSLAVNLIRLFIAFFLIGIFTLFTRGHFLAVDADSHMWTWLLISGVIGFFFGDLFLFESFTLITSRIALLIMTLVPPITALCGWLIMGEILSSFQWIGMGITMTGIALVIFFRGKKDSSMKKLPVKGIIFALFGAIGQAVGYVLSKYGMGEYDAFAASQIRIIAGFFSFAVLFTIGRKWKSAIKALFNTPAMGRITFGAAFGPFLGVGLSLLAAQYTQTGAAATLLALAPVLIIPPTIIFMKQKVSLREVIGAIISVGGAVFFFL